MKNYFILKSEVVELGEVALQTISKHPKCFKFTVGQSSGWAIEDSSLQDLLVSIQAKKAGEERPTDYDGIFLIHIAHKDAVIKEENPKVTTFSWNDNNGRVSSTAFKKVAEDILLPALKGRSIEISVPHGNTMRVNVKKEFQIFIWSSPLALRLARVPQRIWGVEVDVKDEPFKFANKGVNIEDVETGYSVAELIDQDILYVHHDLVHYGSIRELEIWKLLLQKVVEELTMSPKEKAERDRRLAKEKAEKEKKEAEAKAERERKEAEELARKNRERYISECKHRLRVTLDQLRQTIGLSARKISDGQTRLINSIREHRDTGLELDVLVKNSQEVGQYGEDLEQIFSVVQNLVPSLKISADDLKRKKEEYVQRITDSNQRSITERKRAFSETAERIKECEQALLASIRESRDANIRLETLSADDTKEVLRYGQEYDRLTTLPKVKSVSVKEGQVSVFTDLLFCTDPRTNILHEIGEFEIQIPTNGTGGVIWKNLTRTISAYGRQQMAPHVFGDGRACLGNTAEIFPDLIAKYEFSIVATIAIQFIESVNVNDDAGKYISSFPIAKAKTEEAEAVKQSLS